MTLAIPNAKSTSWKSDYSRRIEEMSVKDHRYIKWWQSHCAGLGCDDFLDVSLVAVGRKVRKDGPFRARVVDAVVRSCFDSASKRSERSKQPQVTVQLSGRDEVDLVEGSDPIRTGS